MNTCFRFDICFHLIVLIYVCFDLILASLEKKSSRLRAKEKEARWGTFSNMDCMFVDGMAPVANGSLVGAVTLRLSQIGALVGGIARHLSQIGALVGDAKPLLSQMGGFYGV